MPHRYLKPATDTIREEQDELRMAIYVQIQLREDYASWLSDMAARSRDTIARTLATIARLNAAELETPPTL